jgi:hypothetical protein
MSSQTGQLVRDANENENLPAQKEEIKDNGNDKNKPTALLMNN